MEKFPIENLPSIVRELSQQAQSKLNFPVQYTAMSMLCVAAIAIGKTRVIRVNSTWVEKPIFFIAIIGNPGAIKTPAVSLAFKPLEKINSERIDQYNKAVAQIKKEAKDAGADAPRPVFPRSGQLILKDSTLEALFKVHKSNPAGVHTEPCKSGFTDSHNFRRVHNIDSIPINPNTTIRQELTQNNSSWMASGERHVNCHAHIVWDWYNWDEHRTFKLGKAAMSRWQDLAAEVTGMERGLAVEETGAVHVDVAEFKANQERERAQELKAKNRSLKDEFDLQRDRNDTLKEENKRLDNKMSQIEASVSHSERILEAKADHVPVPQKGRFGYKTSEVDEYIQKTRASDIIKVRSAVETDYSAELRALKQELYRLQAVEKEYLQVKESPDALQKLHHLLWTKHKKEMAEKKELATFLFNTNEEVRVLYFRFYAICKEKNAELDREYEKVQAQYAEAKDLYDKYKTERNLGEMIRLFGKMMMVIEPNIASLLMILGVIVGICAISQKHEAKAVREDAASLSEALKAKRSEYKRERQDFTEMVGVPERRAGKKM